MSTWTETIQAHRTDIAWLVTLWLAIHGSDSVPERIEIGETTATLAAALSAHLAETSHRRHPAEGETIEVHVKMKWGGTSPECTCFGQPGVPITLDGRNVCICLSPPPNVDRIL